MVAFFLNWKKCTTKWPLVTQYIFFLFFRYKISEYTLPYRINEKLFPQSCNSPLTRVTEGITPHVFILLFCCISCSGEKKWKWGVSAYFNHANQFYERLTHTSDKFTSYLWLTYCFFRSLMLHYHQRCVFYIVFLNDVTFF